METKEGVKKKISEGLQELDARNRALYLERLELIRAAKKNKK